MRKNILFLFLPVLIANNLFAQTFQNLDFSQKSDTSKTGLAYWDLSWGKKGDIVGDADGANKNLLIRGLADGAVGFTEQSIDFTLPKEMVFITLSGRLCTKNVIGKGAGLDIQVLDKDGRLITFKDMGGVYSLDWTRGTTQWKNISISSILPPGTAKIKIGAILYGKGEARFSNFKFNVTSITKRQPSGLAAKYISAACAIIKKNSLVRDSLDIESMKKTALQIAGPAKNYEDCYFAIQYLVECLRPYGDEHSFFMKAKERENWEINGSQVSKLQNPESRIIDGFGYISVPAFHGGNPKTILAFADSLQSAIKNLSDSHVKGWIVDLRNDMGGNQEPMIAGLGPLFSSVKLGSLLDVSNQYSTWNYDNGRYFSDTEKGWRVSKPFNLSRRLPIAVLTGPRTGSSGEITTISFIGNELTRSFGQPTWGLTTGNSAFDLPDKSQIFIASTHMVDRNGQIYTGPVIPDVLVKDDINHNSDLTLERALEWLKSK